MNMADREPTVFVVDDDPGVRDAIRLLLRSVGLRSEVFPSAMSFLESYDAEAPGCIVLDLRMPGMSGIELQDRLIELGSNLPIIFVTAHGDVPTAVVAVKAGAVDFIQKPFQDQKLLDMVHHAIDLNSHACEERADLAAIEIRIRTLTPRELAVLELVVEGNMNKVIARELGISQRTVEIHRARVMDKMGANSVSQLVRMVVRSETEPLP